MSDETATKVIIVILAVAVIVWAITGGWRV